MELYELLKLRYDSHKALAAALGLNVRTLYRWEQGHWGPSQEVQKRMLALLNGQPQEGGAA